MGKEIEANPQNQSLPILHEIQQKFVNAANAMT